MRRHGQLPGRIGRRSIVNAKRVSTSLLVIAAGVVLVVFAFRVRIGATADSVAILKTSGMTCGGCSGRVIKALQPVKGVEATEVDLAGGWVIVRYDTKLVKPESLAAKVIGVGFGSKVHEVLTPGQFGQRTGRKVGGDAAPSSGSPGGKGGACGADE
jgi:mercuric ion binding protein